MYSVIFLVKVEGNKDRLPVTVGRLSVIPGGGMWYGLAG